MKKFFTQMKSPFIAFILQISNKII